MPGGGAEPWRGAVQHSVHSRGELMTDTTKARVSRRRLLQGAGAAAVGAVLLRRMTDSPGGDRDLTKWAGAGPNGAGQDSGAQNVTPHGTPLRGIEQAAEDLKVFRPSDALLSGLAAAMVDRTTGASPQLDNPNIPAGYTFLGQFLDHDITLDTTPLDEQRRDPKALTLYRTPRYDLDSVYGGGPTVRPELYDPANPAKLRIGGGNGQPNDLLRSRSGRAIIPEARNDENLLVAQIHLAFMRFHNRVVDHLGG